MRRGPCVLVLVIVAAATAAVAAAPTRAHAEEPSLDVTLEAGAELDTNPEKLTRDPGSTGSPPPAAVGRTGARASLAWRPRPGRALRATALAAAKKYVGEPGVAGEDVLVVATDLRWDARLGTRAAAWGARVSYYDAVERNDDGGRADHDFRTADAALSLTLVGEGPHRVIVSGGARWFTYKPDARYDFAGEKIDLAWRARFEPGADADGGPDGDGDGLGATLDLGVAYGLERRGYGDRARISTCAPGADLTAGCIASAAPARVDSVHLGAVDATWTGERIYGLRYELRADLSNSFGQSLLRHRLELSATTELVWDVVVTARAVVQYNQFLDPLLLSRDVGLLTIEDENRNAFTVHATRDFGARWAVETRVTLYANEFATETLEFRRETAYLGLLARL